MRRRVFTLLGVLLIVLMSHIGQAQTNDHLKCYQVKGDLRLKGLVDIETPQFGLEPGCKIKKAKFFCVPATKSNVDLVNGSTQEPITPLPVSALPAPGDRLCWQVRCPEPFFSYSVLDPFSQVLRFLDVVFCVAAIAPPRPEDFLVGQDVLVHDCRRL